MDDVYSVVPGVLSPARSLFIWQISHLTLGYERYLPTCPKRPLSFKSKQCAVSQVFHVHLPFTSFRSHDSDAAVLRNGGEFFGTCRQQLPHTPDHWASNHRHQCNLEHGYWEGWLSRCDHSHLFKSQHTFQCHNIPCPTNWPLSLCYIKSWWCSVHVHTGSSQRRELQVLGRVLNQATGGVQHLWKKYRTVWTPRYNPDTEHWKERKRK